MINVKETKNKSTGHYHKVDPDRMIRILACTKWWWKKFGCAHTALNKESNESDSQTCKPSGLQSLLLQGAIFSDLSFIFTSLICLPAHLCSSITIVGRWQRKREIGVQCLGNAVWAVNISGLFDLHSALFHHCWHCENQGLWC